MKHLIVIAIISLSFGQAVAQEENTLKIIIKNFSSSNGKVKVGLYNSKENYMGSFFMYDDAEVMDEKEVELIFENVPSGEYAFSIYHDENNNGELDKNIVGIPTEDYAFSNNANGRFGPPKYEECVFKVDQNLVVQTININ
ncbi:MAG: DUF2141 domain-containing protein [Cyclobacteriaceae bacterium]